MPDKLAIESKHNNDEKLNIIINFTNKENNYIIIVGCI